MELHEALSQIADIRRHLARTEFFRGYRSITVGFSGALAFVGAALQSRWVSNPENSLNDFLSLWISIAALSLGVAGAHLLWQVRRDGGGMTREMTLLAVEQFLPCVAVGAVLTFCIVRTSPQVGWMLPGLWSMIFGLGVFASCRILPRPVSWIGFYYVMCGAGCLLWGHSENAFSPWQMAISFGGGQMTCAAVLHWNLERTHES